MKHADSFVRVLEEGLAAFPNGLNAFEDIEDKIPHFTNIYLQMSEKQACF